ncbi:MAG TPA: DUF2157 domain-containing protein [Vicinamibacterales bacterium]|nr:DUF2157 domain-containing protein [Vicinamibacterales bacterium]
MNDQPRDAAAPSRVSRATMTWLQAESAHWVDAGLLDAGSRGRIIARYATESSEHRSMLALTILGALMFAIGVLLLIGYNWSAIPAAGKIAIIIGSVAAAYGGSAAAFSRARETAGEVLALIGVLLFGNAIWLIAQVLHIQGDFPDGFFWWAIGGIATAALLGSWIVGIAGSALLTVWILAAVVGSRWAGDHPVLPFLLTWPVTIALAYRLRSATMVKILAAGAAVWVAFWRAGASPEQVVCGGAALAACLFYSLASWHRPDDAMGRAWQSAAVSILLVVFVPLLITEFHDDSTPNVTWRAAAPALALCAAVLGSFAARGYRALRFADMTIAVTAVAVTAWLVLLVRGFGASSGWAATMTIAFSVLSLAVAVSLIHKALRSDRVSDLSFGVAFALAFLLVRWASLIDSMLWSGAMLLVSSAGFFAIARLWRGRPRRPAVSPMTVGEAR